MVDNLTIAENIFLAQEPLTRFGFVDRRRMNDMARAALRRLRLDLDPETVVGGLSVGQKQMVEIAKALSHRSRLIVMDEPTASLSHAETETLIGVIRQLRAEGIGIVYISHRLDEIFDLGDRITVLRDGRTVSTRPIGEVTRASLVKAMVDRELSELYGEHASHRRESVVLEVDRLGMRHPPAQAANVQDVSFSLRAGEVLGFFGLVGAGRTEIMEMIFGARPSHGTIRIDGRPAAIREPADAIRAGLGFATEDRKGQGLVLEMSVRENFSLTHLERYCRFDFVNRRKEADAAREAVRRFGVKTPTAEQKIVHLSGGNQQKIVLAKWVARNPRVLIVDEPTRGIDVGAKAEVHAQLQELAAGGVGIIVVSSDLPEILAVSDRVVVIRNGRISGEIERAALSQEAVMELATG